MPFQRNIKWNTQTKSKVQEDTIPIHSNPSHSLDGVRCTDSPNLDKIHWMMCPSTAPTTTAYRAQQVLCTQNLVLLLMPFDLPISLRLESLLCCHVVRVVLLALQPPQSLGIGRAQNLDNSVHRLRVSELRIQRCPRGWWLSPRHKGCSDKNLFDLFFKKFRVVSWFRVVMRTILLSL